MPVAIPDVPTMETDVALLLHVPPVAEFVSVVGNPIQITEAPPIGPGNGETLKMRVAVQPLATV